MASREAVVVAAVRSPVGKLGGVLSAVRPDDLAAHIISALIKKTPNLNPTEISDVYFGCANQAGEDNRNVARMAALLAGLPHSVPGCTVNRLCASGLEAINIAARAIIAGDGDMYVAGGVESMSRAPWAVAKTGKTFSGEGEACYDTALGWRFPNPRLRALFPLESMGETAENIVEKYKISRRDQDEFALLSHQRAVHARRNIFHDEIVSIGDASVDEGPREDTNLEKLEALEPVFRAGGTVTAGNASSLNDGAAAVILMEAGRARALGLKPLARWLGTAVAGVDPRYMGLGPVPATQRLLVRLNMKITNFDLIELNEAFAAQTLACARELQIDSARLNVNGGAIALGHPLGASGARLVVTLLHEMRRRGAHHGLTTLCVGVGQGLATAWQAA